jgi:hypothetical protein
MHGGTVPTCSLLPLPDPPQIRPLDSGSPNSALLLLLTVRIFQAQPYSRKGSMQLACINTGLTWLGTGPRFASVDRGVEGEA